MTLFALLELYKQGEATWRQEEPFGDIAITRRRTLAGARGGGVVSALARTIEALLFLSSEPVSAADLAEAAECDADELAEALEELRASTRPASAASCCASWPAATRWRPTPETEPAARRLLARPRTPPLTPAQAETLAIVAYLQPVSRPEITRIRGVSADSAAATLLERGMIEEGGRSQFGAVLYRTTPLFLKLFGLRRSTTCPTRPVGPVARGGGRPARSPAARGRGTSRREPAQPAAAASDAG